MSNIQKEHISFLRRQLVGELTEVEVYHRLSVLAKDKRNADVLEQISRDEARHAHEISQIIGEEGSPNRFLVAMIVLNARVFGLTFALKWMEHGENKAWESYSHVTEAYPQLTSIAQDEAAHEKMLIDLLDDERLKNMGAIVLGLNDALVELTGALAGFTLALSEPIRIAKTGLITGLAAAMSMAASAFLSARAASQATNDGEVALAGKAALYTGVAYVITVLLLVSPYFLIRNTFFALASMLLMAFGIIAFFNFYLSVARETSFRRGFLEMASISSLVALISFGIGYVLS